MTFLAVSQGAVLIKYTPRTPPQFLCYVTPIVIHWQQPVIPKPLHPTPHLALLPWG